MNRQDLISAIDGGDTDGIINLVDRVIALEQGGGGSFEAVHTREEVTGDDVSIADAGEPINLPFSRERGDVLLDYTNPIIPVVVEAGMYAIQVLVVCDSGVQAGGWFDATMSAVLQAGGLSGFDNEVAVSLVDGVFPFAQLYMTIYLEAGDGFRVFVSNGSGLGGSLDFAINVGLIQRIY